MSFISLEQRFNQKVNELYAGATLKFDEGVSSENPNDDPLIVRRPGQGYFTRIDRAGDRSLPVNSIVQDVRRLTLFSLSNRGLLFLAKQQLLQTGNTFKFTRIINPAFIVANAVPFLHVKRNLRPFSELAGKTDTSYENVRKMGTMQAESYDRLKKWKQPQFIANHLNISRNNSPSSLLKRIGGIIGSAIKTTIGNKLSQAFSPVINTISAVNPLLKRNIGEEKRWGESRPELAENSIIQSVETANVNYQVLTEEYFKTELKETTGTKFIKYFSSPDGIKVQSNRNDTQLKTVQGNQASITKAVTGQNSKKISYIKDPLNAKNSRPGTQADVLTPYKPISNKEPLDDIINVSFAIGNKDPIQFRAFIKDLVENATPQYKDFQYIGRVEKFINYTGVQREISFKLSVLAFGESELNGVWRRINYLTGMVFPYGFTSGILQPNIVRLTIGNVYVDQPGYVSSLSTNFNEPAGSWEITKGRQVPIGATVDIKFILIEKATKIAESPFYGITEEMKDSASQRFNKTIVIPKNRTQTEPSTDAPAAAQISEPFVESNLTIAERISAGEALDEAGNPIINP
jgi:hypothetical protein